MRYVLSALAALALLASCGGGDEPKPTTAQLEQRIKAQFEKGAADLEFGSLKIRGVDCTRKSPSEATCRVVGAEYDPDTGRYRWHARD